MCFNQILIQIQPTHTRATEPDKVLGNEEATPLAGARRRRWHGLRGSPEIRGSCCAESLKPDVASLKKDKLTHTSISRQGGHLKKKKNEKPSTVDEMMKSYSVQSTRSPSRVSVFAPKTPMFHGLPSDRRPGPVLSHKSRSFFCAQRRRLGSSWTPRSAAAPCCLSTGSADRPPNHHRSQSEPVGAGFPDRRSWKRLAFLNWIWYEQVLLRSLFLKRFMFFPQS